MFITDDRDIIVRSERNFSQQTKKHTDLPKTWREIPVLQKHTQNNTVKVRWVSGSFSKIMNPLLVDFDTKKKVI